MKDVNKMILVGRLGNTPARKEVRNGTWVTQFSLATSRRVRQETLTAEHEGSGRAQDVGKPADEPAQYASAHYTEETQWHRVYVWGKQGEICAQYLTKGQTVYVEGALRIRNYKSKDGDPRMSVEIHADEVVFLSPARTARAERSVSPSEAMELPAG